MVLRTLLKNPIRKFSLSHIFETILILLFSLFFTQNASAGWPPTLQYPDPDLIIFSMTAPELDTESGMVTGEVVVHL